MVEINDHSLIQTVSLVALAVVAFSVPSVTIAVGSTSSNPSSFSGVTNGSGPYVPITLRATPSSVPYPLTPSGAIDTTFNYSA